MTTTQNTGSDGPAIELPDGVFKVIWPAALLVTFVCGYGITPRAAIKELLSSHGVTDTDAQLLAFAAGYTLPATLGFLISTILVQRRTLEHNPAITNLGIISAIFTGTGILCQTLGLGLLPDPPDAPAYHMPGYLAFPLYVGHAYVNSYGIGLLLTAAALGIASGLQLDHWSRRPGTTIDPAR